MLLVLNCIGINTGFHWVCAKYTRYRLYGGYTQRETCKVWISLGHTISVKRDRDMCGREIGRKKVRDVDISANSIHPCHWKELWTSSLGEEGVPALLSMYALLSSAVLKPQYHYHWSPVSRHHRHASSYLLPSLFSCLCHSDFSYMV